MGGLPTHTGLGIEDTRLELTLGLDGELIADEFINITASNVLAVEPDDDHYVPLRLV